MTRGTIKQAHDFRPGDRVCLSGSFLACTGQRRGGEGAKVWIVQECACGLCSTGQHVRVDEPSTYPYTAEEHAADPGLAWRHIARANLVPHGRPSLRNEAPLIGRLPLGHPGENSR